MTATSHKNSPLNLERIELKYLIPHEFVAEISAYLEVFCQLDRYADSSGYYTINTLYLDAPDYLFYQKRMQGLDDRFNMRIRHYDTEAEGPYFFEIKHKKNGFVKKYRYPLEHSSWHAHFDGKIFMPVGSEIGLQAANFNLFERLGLTFGIEPKILTQYKRKAYFSVIDDYARVTFDSNLKYQKVDKFVLAPNDALMVNYDNPLIFPPGCDVILELKATARIPMWMLDLIRRFDLQRSSFSKYASSVREMTSHEDDSSMKRVSFFM